MGSAVAALNALAAAEAAPGDTECRACGRATAGVKTRPNGESLCRNCWTNATQREYLGAVYRRSR